MGKYMRKAKLLGGVTVMEISQSTLGVRTRAKTLALQRLQSSTATAAPPEDSKPDYCYLELRSRRLEKPPLLAEPIKQAQRVKQSGNRSGQEVQNCCGFKETGSRALSSCSTGSVAVVRCVKIEEDFEVDNGLIDIVVNGLEGVEHEQYGENNLDFEPVERGTRESTPCSFIRDIHNILTPGSSTRGPNLGTSANQRQRTSILTNIPSTIEVDEFFTHAEQQQKLLFIEKYNFDIVNDLPFPGSYEWVKC